MQDTPQRSGSLLARIRPWGLITALGALAAAASVLGFFGACHWLPDVCSHFRVQYALGLGAVAALLLIPRRRRLAALFAALAAVNAAVVLPLCLGRPPPVADTLKPVRALLANVNTATGSPAAVAAEIQRLDPDIIVLEEINARWLAALKPVLDGYAQAIHETREDNFGIGLWSRLPLTGPRVVRIGRAGVPSILAQVQTPRGPCTILATHPPPPAGRVYSALRNDQLAALPRWVRQASSPVLLLGDLNTTPWNVHFRRLVRESGLRDSARGRGLAPTWPTFNVLLRIPIDHALHAPEIGIAARRVGSPVGSDHFPLVVDFAVTRATPPFTVPPASAGR